MMVETSVRNMRQAAWLAGVAVVTALAVPVQAQAIVGPDAAACRSDADGSAVLVNVTGFKRQTGMIRVQIQGSGADLWLDKSDKGMRRIQLPVTAATMPVCVKVAGPGRYAIAVRHDMDGDGKLTSKDGGGFSGNPRLSITHLKPSYKEAVFTVGNDVKPITIVMNYLSGLSIKPVK